jgi:hypothetical protein
MRRLARQPGHQRSEIDGRFHECERLGVTEYLTDLRRTVATHETAVSGRPDSRDQHRCLGDRPIAIENDACVGAPLAVRPHPGVDGSVYNQAMMLRGTVGEFDGGRGVDELRRVPGIGDPRGSEHHKRVQSVASRVDRRGALEERDPALYLVEFGSPMAHERRRDQAEPTRRVVDEITPRPHATSPTLAPDLASWSVRRRQPPRK